MPGPTFALIRTSYLSANPRLLTTPQAQLVGRAIAALLRGGAPPSALGVICFYRAQVRWAWSQGGKLVCHLWTPQRRNYSAG